MSHDRHKHAHCAHTHLAFCQRCQVVYCHDCAMEWTPKNTWWGTTYTSPTITFGSGYKTMTNAECPVTMTNQAPHTHGG